jgi:sodium transport system permease protein
MSPLGRIWNVFFKEVTDNLRDKRSVFSALLSSLIGPILLLIMIVVLGKSVFKDTTENPLNLPVAGGEYAPELVQFLKQSGVKILPAPADPEGEVRRGDLEVVLVILENYHENFRSGRPASIRLVVDSSRQSAITSIERAEKLLESYNQQMGALRLTARGINPEVVQPLAVERTDVATPQSQALIFLNMMPYFIIMVIFVGGMYVIIDTTAGERERGSLEPLLINPVARWEFVIGKLFSAIPFSIFAVILTLIAFAVAFNVFPLEDYVGIQVSISPASLLGIFLISLPMVLLASALQMIIATFTRSFKEAQTYVGFLPLIPALPGIGLAFIPIKASPLLMLIPTFGQQLLINQMMRVEPINPVNLILSTFSTLIVAAVLIYFAISLYARERVMFGTK